MDEIFDNFKKIFNEHNFRLYMIGSTSRNFLLQKEIRDYDFVTDATPDEVMSFLKCNDRYKKFGTLSLKYKDKHIDIVTLREESIYEDSRHPKNIKFIKDVQTDYKRRDFTINAIYIDENYKILDISKDSYLDLKNKILRFIGDPEKRIKEDPLRILRAKRFIVEYDLEVEEKTLNALKKYKDLVFKISEGKLIEEKRKFDKISNGKNYEF